jgi:hypothetical protein
MAVISRPTLGGIVAENSLQGVGVFAFGGVSGHPFNFIGTLQPTVHAQILSQSVYGKYPEPVYADHEL